MNASIQLFHRGAAATISGRSRFVLRALRHVACLTLIRRNAEDIAARWHLGEARDHDCGGGPRKLHACPVRGLKRAHLSRDRPSNDRVADAEGAGLDDHCGDRTATLVALRLDDGTDCWSGWIGLVVAKISDEEDHVEKVIEPSASPGGDGNERHVATVCLDHHV